MGWGKGTSREGKEGECNVGENSFKIHWLQMHQNPFSAGVRPGPSCGSLQRSPTPSSAGEVPLPILRLPASRLSASRSRLRTNDASVRRHIGPNDFLAGGPTFEFTPLACVRQCEREHSTHVYNLGRIYCGTRKT